MRIHEKHKHPLCCASGDRREEYPKVSRAAQAGETNKTTSGSTSSAVAPGIRHARPESAPAKSGETDTKTMKPTTTTTTMADNHTNQQPSGASSAGKESQERNPVLNDAPTDQPVQPPTPPATVWHYTTGLNLKNIEKSGELRPTTNYLLPGEKPILWFSKNQYWEQTASKGAINEKDEMITLTMEQTLKFCGGLFRFGIPVEKAINWPRIAKLANTPSKWRKRLVEVGLKQGANHLEWCGTLEPVPLGECIPQVMNDKMEWDPVKETMPLENPIKTSTGFASRLRRMLGYTVGIN